MPWEETGLRQGRTFGGDAATTLDELVNEAITAVETRKGLTPHKRAICGYSLGGLFALYAFANEARFAACASLSGSLWYPGWVERLRKLDMPGEGRFVFLSVGSEEKRGGGLFRSVEDNTRETAGILRERGCSVHFEAGPGNHLQHHEERFAKGLAALDGALCQGGLSEHAIEPPLFLALKLQSSGKRSMVQAAESLLWALLA